jgi:hypothetical protein
MKSRARRSTLGYRERASCRLEAAFDHHAGAAPDHVARALVGNRQQSLADEDRIQRRDEVGRRVDQGAVKVEDDEGRSHALRALIGIAADGKGVNKRRGFVAMRKG